MKSSGGKEQVEIEPKYVFFTDPEAVAERAQRSGRILRNQQFAQLSQEQCSRLVASENSADTPSACGRKNLDFLLAHQTVKPYPFTFITALKRKLALAAYNETSKNLYRSENLKTAEHPDIQTINADPGSNESLYQTVKKMEFIKPLKVPDVKISPKTLDYSPKDAANPRDATPIKFSMTSQKSDKTPKSTERAHRKLDFSLSESQSLISSDDIEPLKVPDLSISPSLSKKKDHVRDNSREKENRTKRIKKDDSPVTKMEDSCQDSAKLRLKNLKHVSRKDVADPKRSKNDRATSHTTKESDFIARKSKNKNFATSTSKKDDEKRLRSSSIHSTKISRDKSSESRLRTISSESLSDRNFKIHEKTTRESSRASETDASVAKYNDDYQILNALRQIDEQKHKSTDVKFPKTQPMRLQSTQQKSIDPATKDQHKRIVDRTKISNLKTSTRTPSATTEIFEETETNTDSNTNKNRISYVDASSQIRTKISDSSDCQTNANVDSHNATQLSSEEIILDPAKLSFRDDSYSQQDEFCDLVTPEINLTARTKRRKPVIPNDDCNSDLSKLTRQKQTRTEILTNTNVPLVHPTALHMQFQAELHLFDSYNESLRQVLDVEKCLYTVNRDATSRELLHKQRLANEETRKRLAALQFEKSIDEAIPEKFTDSIVDPNVLDHVENPIDVPTIPEIVDDDSRNIENRNKDGKPDVRVAEVQTQTANDIATQTEIITARRAIAERLERYPGITYERGLSKNCEIPEFSFNSLERFDDMENIDDQTLQNKMRTMSEISLHETTSSIKTETGTEISISTRDVTCSFNKYLDLEMAQLIKDEKLMYDKIEMLFKSREKTLNDRTRKLVKLEEQKRVLRDTGQDSRISSVKKKQRALLLKLQQEKDEMNRLKELHKMASQERKLMLQKQRNMFNPQMSTKNILTKLKRTADCQSPRRLSGPMKGYDIRSNSSMSSLVDSDKSQLERSHVDAKLRLSDFSQGLDVNTASPDVETSTAEKIEDTKNRRYANVLEDTESSTKNNVESNDQISRFANSQKLDSKTRKFEEKMPNLRTNYLIKSKTAIANDHIADTIEGTKTTTQNVDNTENFKSESDTLVEELSKRCKSTLPDPTILGPTRDKDSAILENPHGDGDSVYSRKSRASQVTEESLLTNHRNPKKFEKTTSTEREAIKKSQNHNDAKFVNKRKSSKSLKPKSTFNVLTENIPRSKINNNPTDDVVKTTNKRGKNDREIVQTDEDNQNSILEEIDLNESQNSLQALVKHSRAVKEKNYKIFRDIASEHETKENIMTRNYVERDRDDRDDNTRRDDGDVHNLGNISTRSQVSTFTISRHSSGDSEKSFSRSVVIRAQDHRFKTSKKLEQVLNAREAALTTRRNCVEDWIAWHTKLKAEESRVARMEQAAFKLVSTTANALPYHDTTMSSDTSDVEGRVELLAEKLAERRAEMSKLKREARRQAKQRLKALEANLLSQIKKYDTTIHEMRKKLETQKTSIKDSEKLAIESRSVTDFKVPEIPIKRIQEIYNSSDLLRSRSESDLIFTKTLNDDSSRNSYPTNNRNANNENIVYKSSSSLDNKISRLSGLSKVNDARTNRSAESVLEEAQKFSQENSEKRSSMGNEEILRISESRSTESVASEIVGNLQNSGTPTIVESSSPRKSECSDIEEITETIRTINTEKDETKIISEKFETVQLTNKNLNDDISTLENDLKALTEMMSHYSKRSNDKHDSGSSIATELNDIIVSPTSETAQKSISNDISERISRSAIDAELSKERSTINDDTPVAATVEIGTSIDDEQSDILREIEKSKSSRDYFEDDLADVSEVISAIIPDGQSSDSNSDEKIDFEARSKEILNVVEKSIISERAKSPSTESNVSVNNLEDNMKDMIEENEALSHDLNTLEGDIKSISKIISEIAESKRSLESVNDLTEASRVFEKSVDSRERRCDLPIAPTDNDDRSSYFGDGSSHREIVENDEIHTDDETYHEPSFAIENKSPQISPKRKNSVEPIGETAQAIETEILVDPEVVETEIREVVPIEASSKNAKAPDVSSKSLRFDDDADDAESIVEEISASQREHHSHNVNSSLSIKSPDCSEIEAIDRDVTNLSSLENSVNDDNDGFKETEGISIGKVSLENDWTISDSFRVPEKSEISHRRWEQSSRPETIVTDYDRDVSPVDTTVESRGSPIDPRDPENFTCDIEDVSMFVPRGESTNIGYKFDDSIVNVTKNDSMHTDELDDILDIIARESNQTTETHGQPLTTSPIGNVVTTNRDPSIVPTTATSDRIVPRPSDLNLTAEVEPVLQKLTEILQGVERNIARRRKSANDADSNRDDVETKESSVVPISGGESVRTSKGHDVGVERSDERTTDLESCVSKETVDVRITDLPIADLPMNDLPITDLPITDLPITDLPITDLPISEDIATPSSPPIVDDPSEIHETSIPSHDDRESMPLDAIENFETPKIAPNEESSTIPEINEKTFEILKGPEYEDISEESLEVSEILDRSESQRSSTASRKIPDKYETTQKSEDVLRILDAISQKSYVGGTNNRHVHDVKISVQVFGSISPGIASKKDFPYDRETAEIGESAEIVDTSDANVRNAIVDDNSVGDGFDGGERLDDGSDLDRLRSGIDKPEDEGRRKDQDGSSESSEGADTPRGVSEIEMDSPRDANESRLDIDALDDDLLGCNETGKTIDETNVDFHGAPVIATSEKDIEMMIDKLKASLEQPGLEVAELEAKLLRIEQLQIELEIKKLEAEEVSFYVREIPNKPPPPYTPPGGGSRLSTPQSSPTLPPAVVPSNVEELTAFTEKATILIFNAKNSGEDIMSLQPPIEICELTKDKNETAKHDRRIYNTFLFDLCKETIAEVYRSEYEKPGPSWTKPNVKTKSAMKIPKTVDELNEYVSKEVATLFGFKTKLQRENMVMRWSRKRRDRVDELLAREAQAEEDEWTKFHHDELAVKNELTIAILDTLIMETTNVVKTVYAKKRRVMA